MSSILKPSLTEYADTLRVFKQISDVVHQVQGLSQDTVTKINNVAGAIRQAEDSALADRSAMLARKEPGQGTDAWQKANAEPFITVARQAKALLQEEGFTKELANSCIPVANPKDIRATISSQNYDSMTSGYAIMSKATDIATMLGREDTAKGHSIQNRELGRHAIDFHESPFKPVMGY